MAIKVISIEIGNAITRLVQMDYQTKHPKVYRHATIPTPEGSYNDGYINANSNALAVAIQQAIKNNNMEGTKNVIFTIASSKILTREVMIPPVKTNMIDSTVKLNLSEYFPIDLSQHEVATLPLERITAEGDNFGKYRVLIVAAEKDLIKSYEELAKTCGLTLAQVDYAGNSIYQAFKNEQAGRCNMILKIEERQTSITIVDHQNLLLQRNVNYGIEDVINEVVNQAAFGVRSYDEAVKYIRTNKVVLDNLSDTASSVAREGESEESSVRRGGGTAMNEARAGVTRMLAGLISSISRVVDFYNSRFSVPIDRIYICGLGGSFTDLNVLFSNEMGIKTHILKKLEEVQWAALGDNSEFPGYVATIGAAMGPIALYNKTAEKKGAAAINYKFLSIVLLIVLVGLCAILYLPKVVTYSNLKADNKVLKEKEVEYVEAENIYKQYVQVLNFYQAVYTGSLALQNPNENIIRFFEQLEKTLPENSNIEVFESTSEQVSITIRVENDAVAASLIKSIREFDSLARVDVSVIKEVWVDDDALEEDEEGNPVAGNDDDEIVATDESGQAVLERTLDYVEFTIVGYYYPSEFSVLNDQD